MTGTTRIGGEAGSIGVSGHKNEYSTGVRYANWVEEQAGQDASAGRMSTSQVGAATVAARGSASWGCALPR